MRQIFFISPNGYTAVKSAGLGPRTHGWTADGDDPKTQTVIGVVEIGDSCDPEKIIERLEAQGILWLPNHHTQGTISPEHHKHLSRHGVQLNDTTLQAMTKVHGVSGFPPLKPKRF